MGWISRLDLFNVISGYLFTHILELDWLLYELSLIQQRLFNSIPQPRIYSVKMLTKSGQHYWL